MAEQNNGENKVITIYDIAKEAGVSPATVSRVLTNNVKVRQEKRDKVLYLVRKYNFRPNALARSLSDTRSKVIGILVADIRNPYYAELFASCERAAHNAGYTVLLTNSSGDPQREGELIELLQEQRVDAFIQMGGSVDALFSEEQYEERLNRDMAHIPVVVTGKVEGMDCHMVRIDSAQAMKLLMEHLTGLGHKRIALIGGRMDVLGTHEKFLQYQQCLAEHRLVFDPTLVAEGGSYDMESGYELMNRMFENGAEPTAVIAVNDFSAAGIVRSIVEHGKRIPEDISVVGYDNTYIARMMIPPLTSIDYNYEEYGNRLVQTAICAIEGKETDRLQTVTPRLVVRGSSGKAPE